MVTVHKAILPAAGNATRLYPASASIRKGLFPIVDVDGLIKPILHKAVEEVLSGGIKQVAIIINPRDEESYRRSFAPLTDSQKKTFQNKPLAWEWSDRLESFRERITFLHQAEPRGYGHAVWCAKEWVGDEPCVIMLGDCVFLSHCEQSCTSQLVKAFMHVEKSISALHRYGPERLRSFGTVRAKPLLGTERLYQFEAIVEKPSPEYAREHLITPGLPPDTYLGWFGQHLVTPELFACLDELVTHSNADQEVGFTEAQAELLRRDTYYGIEIQGTALDIGQPDEYLTTMLQLGLAGPYRETVLNAIER